MLLKQIKFLLAVVRVTWLSIIAGREPTYYHREIWVDLVEGKKCDVDKGIPTGN